MRLKIRVRLEPELEATAKDWSPEVRLVMAKKMRRWAHELEVSAKIIASDANYRPMPRLQYLKLSIAVRN